MCVCVCMRQSVPSIPWLVIIARWSCIIKSRVGGGHKYREETKKEGETEVQELGSSVRKACVCF